MYSEHFKIDQIDATFESFLASLDSAVGFIPDRFKHKNKAALQAEGTIQ